VEQPHHRQFVTFDVREDLALEFDCSRRNDPEYEAEPGSSDRYGKYFGTVFSLKTPAGQSGTTILLWTKEKKNWKIISYEVDPGLQEALIPDLRPDTVKTISLARIPGDPDFVEANFRFLNTWIIDRDFDQTIKTFASSCNKCVSLYLPEGESVPTDEKAIRARLRLGLEKTAGLFSHVAKPRDIVKPVEPVNTDIRIMQHEYEDVFTLLSIPDHMGVQADCSRRLSAGQNWEVPDRKTYGNYYATAFELRLLGGDAAALYLVWRKTDKKWQIVAYHIVAP
jgi:hypothetical protein